MIQFGSAKVIATPTTLADGSAIATPTPVVLAHLQEITVDMSVDLKTLYGQGMFPIAVAQGKAKIEAKAKQADVSGAVLGSLFLGQASTAGVKDMVSDFLATPSASVFEVTVAPPASGTFVADLGAFDANTGAPLQRVATAPAAGQYKVDPATAKYTFSSQAPVLLSYEYSVATGGQIYTLNQRNMGYTPSFSTILKGEYDGKALIAKFYRGVSSKFSLPFKSEDFTTPDFEAQFFANAAGQVGWICLKG